MPRVLLYGQSLFIAGLQASLEAVSGLVLKDVEAQSDHLQEHMAAWKPDVLIFELDNLSQIPSLVVLKDYPGLLLIGMDTECNHLLVLSNQQQQALSTTDLVKVIQRER
jgi:hypothetical protein